MSTATLNVGGWEGGGTWLAATAAAVHATTMIDALVAVMIRVGSIMRERRNARVINPRHRIPIQAKSVFEVPSLKASLTTDFDRHRRGQALIRGNDSGGPGAERIHSSIGNLTGEARESRDRWTR
jgi:hypothetical protein